MDNLDFLDGQQPADTTADAITPEPTIEATPEPTGPERGPDGKFVSRAHGDPQPELAPVLEAPAAETAPTPAPAAAPPGDDRIAQMEAQIAGLTKALTATRRQAREAPPPPNLYEDPEGHVGHIQHTYEERLLAQRNEYSFRMVAAKHGQETAQKVHDWAFARCDQDPAFNQRLLTAEDPYEVAVAEFNRDQVLSKLTPENIDRIMGLLAQPTQAAFTPPTPSPAPPRSLASAPSAGAAKPGEQPAGPGVAFSNAFER